MKTMLGALYENLRMAYFAVLSLRQSGFDAPQIGFLMQDFHEQRENQSPLRFPDNENLPVWAEHEVVIKSLKALLSRMAIISVPNVGAVLAAGLPADMLSGVREANRNLALIFGELGMSAEDSIIFQKGLLQGQPLITLQADSTLESRASRAIELMRVFTPNYIGYSSVTAASAGTVKPAPARLSNRR